MRKKQNTFLKANPDCSITINWKKNYFWIPYILLRETPPPPLKKPTSFKLLPAAAGINTDKVRRGRRGSKPWARAPWVRCYCPVGMNGDDRWAGRGWGLLGGGCQTAVESRGWGGRGGSRPASWTDGRSDGRSDGRYGVLLFSLDLRGR